MILKLPQRDGTTRKVHGKRFTWSKNPHITAKDRKLLKGLTLYIIDDTIEVFGNTTIPIISLTEYTTGRKLFNVSHVHMVGPTLHHYLQHGGKDLIETININIKNHPLNK